MMMMGGENEGRGSCFGPPATSSVSPGDTFTTTELIIPVESRLTSDIKDLTRLDSVCVVKQPRSLVDVNTSQPVTTAGRGGGEGGAK